MAQVSNTLNRWHKVVERIQQSLNRVNVRIEQQSQVSINYANREIRAAQAKEQEKEVLSLIATRAKLMNTIAQIRSVINRQNTETGISEAMAKMQALQAQANALDTFLRSAERWNKVGDVLTTMESDAKMAIETKTQMRNVNDVATVMSAESIAELRKTQEQLTREVHVLSDKISDANATKVVIDIDEEVATHVGI
jgi:hypothetical protein